jgi:uncharacterized protein
MARSPWLVPITAIRRSPGTRHHEHRSGPVGELVVAGTTVPAGADAEADVDLDVIDGGIEVSGRVTAPWRGECRRCLRPVAGRLEVDVRELYSPPGRSNGDEAAEEELYPLVGEQLDLHPLVRDALLLELPLAPLCNDDCAGLCATCGAVLDEGDCGCDPGPVDQRWDILDALKPQGRG